MYQINLQELPKCWHNSVRLFEVENNCDASYWRDEFIQWLREKYSCIYWELEQQHGGPSLVFNDQRDYTMFLMKFA